jgi:hypothetical protein
MANETEWLKIALELVGLAGGAIAIIYTLKGDVKSIGKRMDDMETQFKSQALKLDSLSQLFIQFARFDERFTNLVQQLTLTQKKVDELAHGQGFVVPFKPPEH